MRIADDYDLGTIILTVVVTLFLGALVYAYISSSNLLQTASMLPVIERTVPTIVPSQPGL
jgi:hypothetical protein